MYVIKRRSKSCYYTKPTYDSGEQSTSNAMSVFYLCRYTYCINLINCLWEGTRGGERGAVLYARNHRSKSGAE